MYRKQLINGQEYWVWEDDPPPGTALTPEQRRDQQGYYDWMKSLPGADPAASQNPSSPDYAAPGEAQKKADAAKRDYFDGFTNWQQIADDQGRYHWYASDQDALAKQRQEFDKAEKERAKQEGRNYVPKQFTGQAPVVDMTERADQPVDMPGSPTGKGTYGDAKNYWDYEGAPPRSYFDQQERTRANASLYARTGY